MMHLHVVLLPVNMVNAAIVKSRDPGWLQVHVAGSAMSLHTDEVACCGIETRNGDFAPPLP